MRRTRGSTRLHWECSDGSQGAERGVRSFCRFVVHSLLVALLLVLLPGCYPDPPPAQFDDDDTADDGTGDDDTGGDDDALPPLEELRGADASPRNGAGARGYDFAREDRRRGVRGAGTVRRLCYIEPASHGGHGRFFVTDAFSQARFTMWASYITPNDVQP